MASSEKLYTRSQVMESMRLAIAAGKVHDSVLRDAAVSRDKMPNAPVLRFLGLEPVGKKFRRCTGASVDTAGAAGVSDGFGKTEGA